MDRWNSTFIILVFLAKPIDLLAKYISSEENVDAIEMHEPYMYLTGLSIQDLEDLIEDIKVRTVGYCLRECIHLERTHLSLEGSIGGPREVQSRMRNTFLEFFPGYNFLK